MSSPSFSSLTTKQRVALLLLSAQCLLFTGLTFGWTSIQIMLREDGVFACSNGEDVCNRQTIRFGLVFTVAQFGFGVAGPIAGYMLDDPRFGIEFVGNCGCLMVGLGCFLLGNVFSSTTTGDSLILPGMALIGAGGPTIFYPMLRRADAFPTCQAHVITLLNALFDGSPAIFALLLIMYEAGESRQLLFGVFGGLAIMFIRSNSVVSKLAPSIVSEEEVDQVEEAVEEEAKPGNSDTQTLTNKISALESLTLMQMLKTKEFISLAAFGCVHVLHSNTYLGFVGDALLDQTSQSRVETLIRMFSFMLPFGVVTTPIVGHIVHQGPWISLMVTNVAGCVHTLASVLIPIAFQPVTFALFVVYRTLLYSSLVAAVASLFGYSKMGSLLGVLFSLASVFALLSYAVAWWTVRHNDGDWRWGFALIGLLQLPLFLLTLNTCKRNEDDEQPTSPSLELVLSPSSVPTTGAEEILGMPI